MSKNVVAYNCDFLIIHNGAPMCTHPDKPRFLCEPFDLACDHSSFEKIYKEHPTGHGQSSERCVVCRHNCQSRARDVMNSGTRCGDHPMTELCIHKDRCKARVIVPGASVHYCMIQQKEVSWFDSCYLFEKRGECGE